MQENVENNKKSKDIKTMPKGVSIVCFSIIGLMAYFPFVEYLSAEKIRFLLFEIVICTILLLVLLIGLLSFLYKKLYKKSFGLLFVLLVVSFGEFDAYIGFHKSVPENYYKDMTSVLKDKKVPISIKKYLYDASSDGYINYIEWLVFSTRYDLFLTTHQKDIDVDEREQDKFLRTKERVVM